MCQREQVMSHTILALEKLSEEGEGPSLPVRLATWRKLLKRSCNMVAW